MIVVRQVAGTLLMVVTVVLSSGAIYELVRTSACASPPGPVALPPCPDGTGEALGLLLLGILVLGPVAAWLIRRPALVLVGWWVLWTSMGVAALVGGHGAAAPPGAQAAADGVGVTFLVIGVLSMLGHAAVTLSLRGRPVDPPDAGPPPDPGPDAELAELTRLAALDAGRRVDPDPP